jgi:hypothetical protein
METIEYLSLLGVCPVENMCLVWADQEYLSLWKGGGHKSHFTEVGKILSVHIWTQAENIHISLRKEAERLPVTEGEAANTVSVTEGEAGNTVSVTEGEAGNTVSFTEGEAGEEENVGDCWGKSEYLSLWGRKSIYVTVGGGRK